MTLQDITGRVFDIALSGLLVLVFKNGRKEVVLLFVLLL